MTMRANTSYMERTYCAASAAEGDCFSFASELQSCQRALLYCLEPNVMAQSQELSATATLLHVLHIMCTIMPIVCWFALARYIGQKFKRSIWLLRFLVEFLLITLPTILCVNLANRFVELIVCALIVVLLVLFRRSQCMMKARMRHYVVGTRPLILTLTRATISFLTALCILAIDFESFPKMFRKSRRFGVGLMDVGIGLFVYAMGSVSQRPQRSAELRHMLRLVMPVLLLGLTRTVVIMAIDYHQDEHEYGVHLNAFFTLGITKLFGTLLSALASRHAHLLPMGVCVLLLHELALQAGLSDFVMNDDVQRHNFWTANREGLCSLPGFIGIYLISMYIGKWLQAEHILNFKEYWRKLKQLLVASGCIWLLVFINCFSWRIARVTCNFGYAVWIIGVALTMTLCFSIVFDLLLNTLWPIDVPEQNENLYQTIAHDVSVVVGDASSSVSKCVENAVVIPTLVEAVNRNGLVFFLLANILTGGVNIYLNPDDRTDLQSVFILMAYMFISTGFVYVLYRFKLRIA